MTDRFTSDDAHADRSDERRDFLRAVAATGIGLTAVPTANAHLSPEVTDGVTPDSEVLWYDGFEHQAVGDASLEAANGSLLVSSGGSGDGVTVNVGEAESFGVGTPLDPEQEPGTGLAFSGRGVVEGEPDAPLGDLRVTRADEGFALDPDFRHFGVDTYSLEVFRDGDLVYDGSGFDGSTFLTPADPYACYEIVIVYLGPFPVIRVEFSDACLMPVGVPGGPEIDADRIDVFPDDFDASLDAVTDVDVLADDLTDFVVNGETVGLDGHDLWQAGDSCLFPRDGGASLDVGCLVEDDGIAVGLDDVATFGLSVEPFDLRPEGRSVTTSSRGTVDGEPDVPLGSVTLTGDGDGALIEADFTSIGSDSVRFVVYNGEEKAGETVVDAGEVGYIDGGGLFDWCGTPHPPEWPFPPWPPEPPRPPCPPTWDFGFDGTPVPFPAVDGSEFVGDQLRLQAVEGAEMSGLTEFGLTTRSVDQLTVHDALSR